MSILGSESFFKVLRHVSRPILDVCFLYAMLLMITQLYLPNLSRPKFITVQRQFTFFVRGSKVIKKFYEVAVEITEDMIWSLALLTFLVYLKGFQ